MFGNREDAFEYFDELSCPDEREEKMIVRKSCFNCKHYCGACQTTELKFLELANGVKADLLHDAEPVVIEKPSRKA